MCFSGNITRHFTVHSATFNKSTTFSLRVAEKAYGVGRVRIESKPSCDCCSLVSSYKLPHKSMGFWNISHLLTRGNGDENDIHVLRDCPRATQIWTGDLIFDNLNNKMRGTHKNEWQTIFMVTR
ncbi:hypothetical protein TSUD_35890 [Trifolium subterraneum]|uniref:Uncharacterized protein n=1 Tax=Trifolium subterraneum TaxID=3900 RepID=A0A2Z6NWA1_TRISU|nr:hypothetical protein TSUD_35890 [Trifolium subterraneum]